jgi:hypothetical protein
VNDDVPNRNYMPIGNIFHDVMSSQGRISALPPTRHKVLDWFSPSRGVIAIRSVLMYYAIEISFSLFLPFRIFLGFSGDVLHGVFWIVFNVDLSSLFIVGEPHHGV